MVRVALSRAESVEQPTELLGTVARQPDREVWPTEGRQQLEPGFSKSSYPGQVDGTVGGEAVKESLKRGRPDVIERAEDRDAPQRLAVEYEGLVGPQGVVGELRQRRRPASNDDNAVVRRALVANMGPELLLNLRFGHVAYRPGGGSTRSATSWAASSCRVGETWL